MATFGSVVHGEDDEEQEPEEFKDAIEAADEPTAAEGSSLAAPREGQGGNVVSGEDNEEAEEPPAAFASAPAGVTSAVDEKQPLQRPAAPRRTVKHSAAKESPLAKELRAKNGKLQRDVASAGARQLGNVDRGVRATGELFDKALHLVKDVSYNVRLSNVDLEELFTCMTESLATLETFHGGAGRPETLVAHRGDDEDMP